MKKLLNIEKNKKQNLRKAFESKGKIISMYDIWKLNWYKFCLEI